MAERIDRGRVKREARALLRDAQVSPRRFYALFLTITGLLELLSFLADSGQPGEPFTVHPLALFVQILVSLVSVVLNAGCWLYCMAVRRGERTEYLTLFDGFSFAGRLVLLELAKLLFIFLWSIPSGMILGVMMVGYGQEIVLSSLMMVLLVLPPAVALYRYRFAVLDLCEDPSLGAMDAIALSKRQTMGYKRQLLSLDLSFLGWILLSGLPQLYLFTADYMSAAGMNMPVPPDWVSIPLQLAVPIVVGCFYLPRYQAMELDYFETAKRTSGTTAEDRSRRGPDNMGGYF